MNVGSIEAEMKIFWMERERGSDVAIIGSGANKRVIKNTDLLNLIYFAKVGYEKTGRASREGATPVRAIVVAAEMC